MFFGGMGGGGGGGGFGGMGGGPQNFDVNIFNFSIFVSKICQANISNKKCFSQKSNRSPTNVFQWLFTGEKN